MRTGLGGLAERALPLLFLVGLPLVFFWQVTLAQTIWFGGDFLQLFHPFGLELSRALASGRLPLWSSGMLSGFPLLAEGEVGALYPVNLILFRALPAHLAISYELLFHLAWAGCGIYFLARTFPLSRPSALLAGVTFSFNGFLFAHLSHPPIVAASAWLPWLLLFLIRFRSTRLNRQSSAALWFGLMTIAIALQFLVGSMQAAFVNVIAFACFGFEGAWRRLHRNGVDRFSAVRETFLEIALPLLLGAGLAAAQLLPTAELVGYSTRSSGVGEEEFVSYSLPPDFVSQFASPYQSGEPSGLDTEYFGYFGLSTLLLAVCAPFLRRDRRTLLLFASTIVALLLALGGLNPLYHLLYYVPGFSFFRVPARYLILFIFASALLAGSTLNHLSARPGSSSGRWDKLGVAGAVAGASLLAIVLARVIPLEYWFGLWRVLPFVLTPVALGLIAAGRTRRIPRAAFNAGMLALVIFDLTSYATPFVATIYTSVPPDSLKTVPRPIQFLDAELANTRTFTELSYYPSVAALRAGLFPNTALLYGKKSAQGYTSLAYRNHSYYLSELSPAMLNLLNVGYYAVPLETLAPDVPAAPPTALGLDLLNQEAVISPTAVSSVRVASFTEQAASLPAGSRAGELELTYDDGTSETLPLRLGIDTADWDYDRTNAEHALGYDRPELAHSYPAFWRSFGKRFEGHTYLASYEVERAGSTRRLISVKARSLLEQGRLYIEGVWLDEDPGNSFSLATLAHKDNFSLAFKSDTVAYWQNQDAMPRAFIVHSAEIENDYAAFPHLKQSGFPADRLVLLASGEPLALSPYSKTDSDSTRITVDEPDQVVVDAFAQERGYLVLADSWYPGWNAAVDGVATPIYRADVLFRAVPISPGHHTISFRYEPVSFTLGIVISTVSLALTIGFAFRLAPRVPRTKK